MTPDITLGNHIIIDYYNCQTTALSNPEEIEQIIRKAAELMQATVITGKFHHFSPLGVSGVLVISESHITIHTWPEHHYCAIDIFYCGALKIEEGLNYLKEALQSNNSSQKEFKRGLIEEKTLK